ncbi:NADH:flavin oxidoreductase/NADH oxidase family protein [[Mycobacterium] kokjensenii]|uniref:NADH:flavin oxidoreductase/NADH oxidase family protein n=1 Tax=[Mycobacterium] kokjensenii TaxID=3064287 RepID=A0ABN9MSI8_9MYCO|nr:NADH:flavin oxidoreductase/NADH oxidase family protein [Mycolicibacter sp. MU0083]CAJ1494371.1 NADH:flavin oxidoreductase/NADH oxidase family protein [Mycolicibacter sp. MU0083]
MGNGTVVPNRLAKAAMSECLGSPSFAPTRRHVSLYERFAAGGAGLIITGNVMIDRSAIGEVGNVVVEDDRDLPILRQWASAAKSSGAVALAQINHPGRQVLAGVGSRPVAPSAVKVRRAAGVFRTPRALTAAEINGLITRFADSARILVDAGFDGVEIHAAHGYLISQFLSPLTNLRADAWGGSLENRSRFLLEVIAAVRAAVRPAAVAVKLNSADFQRGGFEDGEARDVVRMLDGLVDLVEISGGTYESTAFMGVSQDATRASTRHREAYFLDFAESVRGSLRTPLMLTGGFRTAAGMTAAIESGAVDLVGLARPLALDPALPARLLQGSAAAGADVPRRLGLARFDGMTDLIWHTVQLQRMGRGLHPAPDRHPLLTMAEYGWHYAPYLWTRMTGGRSR